MGRIKRKQFLCAPSASASARSIARTSAQGAIMSPAAPSLPGSANTQELGRTIQRANVKNAIW